MLNRKIDFKATSREVTQLNLWDEKLEEVVDLHNQLLEAHKELAELLNKPSFGKLDIRAQAIKSLNVRIDALTERLANV